MPADLDGDGDKEVLVVTSKRGVNINPGFELVAFDGTGKTIWKTNHEKPWGLQIIVLVIMICIVIYILFSSRYKMGNPRPPDDGEGALE